MFKPDARFERVIDITPDFLEKHNIKALILDVDNTLINLKKEEVFDIEKWTKEMKDADIGLCICSNSSKKKIVEQVATKIDIPFVYFSLKPLKYGLKRALKIISEKYGIRDISNVAEVGDQLYTDCLGAKRMGLFSILTKPIEYEKNFFGRFKRSRERKHLEKVYKGEGNVH